MSELEFLSSYFFDIDTLCSFFYKNARIMADISAFFISLSCHIVVIGFVGRHTGKRLALFRNIGEIATLIKLQLALNGIDESALLLVELYTSCK